MYKSTVSNNTDERHYIQGTETTFKEWFSNHNMSFKIDRYVNYKLLKYICSLKVKKYQINLIGIPWENTPI